MAVRIASGAGVLAVVCLVVFLGKEAFDVACAVLSFVAINEFFSAFRHKGYKPLFFAGYVSCACLMVGSISGWNRVEWSWLLRFVGLVDIKALLYFALIAMFCLMIFRSSKYSVSDLSVTVLGSLYVCVLFWYLILVRNLSGGEYIVWFVLLGAAATDTCAYFVGTALGRHKLIPEISPKKTVEGAVGGVVACALVFVLLGLLMDGAGAVAGAGAGAAQAAQARAPSRVLAAALKYAAQGTLSGVIAQIGDLAASCIKRFCGIKDFGRILPGHGGILDRLDSVLVLAPLIYIIFS
ncbi:MAG: phosphatidate cytidylyltransferase [Clostridiales bacterium]|jgi:phosphatidate cytidylyltransferase|nr:phosphatidate cytidylyltransferase [Clostridiales bacterium]